MKKLMNKIKRRANKIAVCARRAVADKKGEGYIDTGLKILISVILGAMLLAGLYALLNGTILPTVTTKITSLFSYTGN